MRISYEFTADETQKLSTLEEFMLEYNKSVNLTRITEHDDIWEKHFIDSALPLNLFDVPRGTRIIDIGTGAGFPGAVWNILRPDLDIMLLDSLQKRIDYLNLLKTRLDLHYHTIHGRSEELAHKNTFREKYDISVSRAVANLPSLLEYSLPFVKVGGYFISMKGANPETENISNALIHLGGEFIEVIEYELPKGDKRHLIIIKKISQTPTNFPRKSTNISKNPL